MLKKTIKYEDYNGDIRVEDFYFNLTRTELLEMEFISSDGNSYTDSLRTLMSTPDNGKIIEVVKNIILKAYGEKSPDGRRFIKSDTLREEFEQSPAYDVLYIEMATDAKAASDFFNGLLPSSISSQTKDLSPKEIADKWKEMEDQKVREKIEAADKSSN